MTSRNKTPCSDVLQRYSVMKEGLGKKSYLIHDARYFHMEVVKCTYVLLYEGGILGGIKKVPYIVYCAGRLILYFTAPLKPPSKL